VRGWGRHSKRSAVRGQRKQKAEGGRQRAEGQKGRRQKAESRRQKAEGRRQKAEGRKQKAEGRRQKAESRKQKAEGIHTVRTRLNSPVCHPGRSVSRPSSAFRPSAFCLLPSAFLDSLTKTSHELVQAIEPRATLLGSPRERILNPLQLQVKIWIGCRRGSSGGW